MSCWRSLSLLCLAGLTLFLTAGLRRQPPLPTAPPPVYPLHPDPAAAQALDRAISALAPQRRPWIKAAFRQKVTVAPLVCRVEGICLAGPGQQLRLELQVDADGARKRLQVVSDGQTFWEAEQNDGEPWTAFKVDRQLLRGSDMLTTNPWCSGPVLLLQKLQQQLTFTRTDALRWRDRDVLLLTGARQGKPGRLWPLYQPRQCRLVLDAATGWPHHLEWWGPVPGVQGDALLVQLELREIALNGARPEEAFRFALSGVPVADRTPEWLQKTAQSKE